MAAATPVSYDAVLREMWPQDAIYDLLLEDAPLLAMLPKDTDFYEKVRHIALGYGSTQGVGTNFSIAKAAKSSSRQAKFDITTTTLYSLFSITRKLIKQSKNNRGAIVRALARESELAIKSWKREVALMLPSNGGGARGQGDSAYSVAGTLITLADANTALNFEVDQQIQLGSTDGTTGSVRAGFVTVTAVSYEAGTVTVDQTINVAIPGALNSDFIFRNGDFGAWMPGVRSFITDTGSPAVLYGMTRTDNVTRKSGVRTASAGLPRETAMKAAKDLKVQGAKPSHYFLHPADYLALQLDLASGGVLMNIKEPGAAIGKYQFGMPFDGLAFHGPSGMVKCFPDYNFTSGVAYMLQMDTWRLASLGDLGYIEDTDGLRLLREENADSYEGRVVGDFALYTEAPGYSARVAQ